MANIYITTEPEYKLKQLFSNIKDFYILDVQQLVDSMDIELSKTSSVYLINEEIEKIITSKASLKRIHGIFYIIKNMSEQLVQSVKKRLSKLEVIDQFILIDNGYNPQHSNFTHLFSDVIFYERFRKNKIIYQAELQKEENKDTLTLLLDEIDN